MSPMAVWISRRGPVMGGLAGMELPGAGAAGAAWAAGGGVAASVAAGRVSWPCARAGAANSRTASTSWRMEISLGRHSAKRKSRQARPAGFSHFSHGWLVDADRGQFVLHRRAIGGCIAVGEAEHA